jgi:hypothetical protein
MQFWKVVAEMCTRFYAFVLTLLLCGHALADELAADRIASADRFLIPRSKLGLHLFSAGEHEPSKYAIGDGIDTATGEDLGACLKDGYTAAPTSPATISQQVRFAIDKIEDAESLHKVVSANAGGSISAGFGTASASGSWLSSHALNIYSLYLLVSVDVENSERDISNEDLAPMRAALISSAGGVSAFRTACGDVYVRGMVSGGQLNALYEFKTRSESDRQVVSAAIDAKGIQGGWTAAAQFSDSIDKASKLSSIVIRTFYQGPAFPTGDNGSIPTDPEPLVKFATHFPSLVAQNVAWGYKAVTKKYTTLPSWPKNFDIIGIQQLFLDQADIAFFKGGCIGGLDCVHTEPL